MKIHFVASLPHYDRHLEPIHQHIPDELRGSYLTGPQANARRLQPGDVVVVAGWADIDRTGPYHRVVYLEHGAGQTYHGDKRTVNHPAYSGSNTHPSRVVAYLAPSQMVADRWDRPAWAVGCPYLDSYHANASYGWYNTWEVCIGFHWNCRICPEAGTARHHYVDRLPEIVQEWKRDGWRVTGTFHPRDSAIGPRVLRNAGVDQVYQSPTEVFNNARLLVMDNSSLMYEFASLGRPVVALNCPEYRRDVHHGLRFWDRVPGFQVDSPEALLDLDLDKYAESKVALDYANEATDGLYANRGTAARTAAEVLTIIAREL